MRTFILQGKNASENIVVNVPFADLLSVGETISSLTVTITVYSGADPTPSNVLYGVPTTDSTNLIAIFTLTGGVVGVTYIVSVLVTGSTGSIVQKQGYLSIVATDPY